MREMRDDEFLNWVADRLVRIYGESENVDFVLKLRKIADEMLVINPPCDICGLNHDEE